MLSVGALFGENVKELITKCFAFKMAEVELDRQAEEIRQKRRLNSEEMDSCRRELKSHADYTNGVYKINGGYLKLSSSNCDDRVRVDILEITDLG